MGKFSAYKVPLKSMVKGTHEFEFHPDKAFFANMENADIRDADLSARLTVVYNGEYYDLTFRITGEVVLLCDRCLDDLRQPVDTSYHVTVRYGEDYNDEADDVLEIPDSENTLNVAYMVYDTVVLAIPIKHVHPMGKCNRQMSAILRKHRARGDEDADFGSDFADEAESMADAATDPRWDALRKIAGDTGGDETGE